jgi:copper ion binding protein
MEASNHRARSWAPLAITLAAVGIALALVVVGVFSRQDSSPPTSTEEAHMSSVVIPVEGMSCVACAARVKKTVASIAGVREVEVSLAERNARVRFDTSRLAADRIVAAINGLGYRAGTPTEAK